jgi:hypothetical protein
VGGTGELTWVGLLGWLSGRYFFSLLGVRKRVGWAGIAGNSGSVDV